VALVPSQRIQHDQYITRRCQSGHLGPRVWWTRPEREDRLIKIQVPRSDHTTGVGVVATVALRFGWVAKELTRGTPGGEFMR
jgi:hypothetical protein